MSDLCEHETFKDVCGICHRDGVITRLRAENERLRAALEEIAAAKPQQISDTGFQQGPLSLWMWAKRTARAALGFTPVPNGQPAPSPWRSIETAPKDGTEVLMVFVFEDGETLHRVVRWDGSEMWPWRDEYTGYREGEAKGWMPLLPAPGKEEA